jgi:hypothetical protein
MLILNHSLGEKKINMSKSKTRYDHLAKRYH